uniref:Uncharacterized protein n=1 Tax=Opuntia streptacantha TaxID=393608 RepID=A0A7C9CN50_OPUST
MLMNMLPSSWKSLIPMASATLSCTTWKCYYFKPQHTQVVLLRTAGSSANCLAKNWFRRRSPTPSRGQPRSLPTLSRTTGRGYGLSSCGSVCVLDSSLGSSYSTRIVTCFMSWGIV